ELGTPEPLRPGAIVQNAGIADFEEAGGWQMHAFVIEQLGEGDDRLVRDWPRPSSGVDQHRGYAFQWYGLAAAAFVFFIVTGLNRGTKPTDEQRS
ncbi:MAG TPA: SURF1 family cytochrome oxidase biogenesis protein, partial [Noviherbaspirillum sp.]